MSGCQEFPGKLQFIDFILGISIFLIAHFLRATIFLHTFIIPAGPNIMFSFLLSLHILTRFSDLQKRSGFCLFVVCLLVFLKNLFFKMGLCDVSQSGLEFPMSLLPQPPKLRGLEACATTPGLKRGV